MCETENPSAPGYLAKSLSMSVPLPTPLGPQITTGRKATVEAEEEDDRTEGSDVMVGIIQAGTRSGS